MWRNDYYPFGAILPGRSFNSNSYKYGFNGQEKDDEIKGSGNSYDFGARIYDSRLGRMLSRDPLGDLAYPSITPYSEMGGNPITNIDSDGKLIIYFSGYWMGQAFGEPQLDNWSYWDVQLLSNVQAEYHDNNAMFFRGDTDLGSSAPERYNNGLATARLYAQNIRKQLDSERKTNPNAKITSVAHSMGVSYSSGFITQLLNETDENGNPLFKESDFGDWNALAAFQAEDVKVPNVGGSTNQFAADFDPLAHQDKIPNVDNFSIIDGLHGNGSFASQFKLGSNVAIIKDVTPEGKMNRSRYGGAPYSGTRGASGHGKRRRSRNLGKF
jgi:RHS repeat-associated protein